MRNIPIGEYSCGRLELVNIYECFCDRTRLRILSLLCQSPLCVCHIQEILKEPQVKVSKHLRYLKTRGLIDARREANWRVYSLASKPTRALRANLACLQDCAQEDKIFRRDSEKLTRFRKTLGADGPLCCLKPQP